LIYSFFRPNAESSSRFFLQKLTADFHLSRLRLTINVSCNNFIGFFRLVALGKTD
jgi:hypothetical protein